MARKDTPNFIDPRLVLRIAFIAAAVQLVLEGAVQLFPTLAGLGLLFARMMVSATAGYVYGLIFGKGYLACAVGGAIAGGLCAVPALLVGALLGESELVLVGAGISVLTGTVGGAFGQMGATLRKLGF